MRPGFIDSFLIDKREEEMKRKLLSILAVGLFLFGSAGGVSAGLIITSGDITPAAYVDFYDNGVFFENILQGGSSVAVHDLSYSGSSLSGYYNDLAGVGSTYLGTTTITASSLSGLDLFITGMQTDAFSASELVALNGFVKSGGSVLFMGDYTAPVTFINDALAYVGSGMSLIQPNSFPGDQIATGSAIASDPLTAGVSDFAYGATYGVTGGTPLFLDHSGRPFMAYETAVPVPAAIFLFGSGLIGLFGFRFSQTTRV